MFDWSSKIRATYPDLHLVHQRTNNKFIGVGHLLNTKDTIRHTKNDSHLPNQVLVESSDKVQVYLDFVTGLYQFSADDNVFKEPKEKFITFLFTEEFIVPRIFYQKHLGLIVNGGGDLPFSVHR